MSDPSIAVQTALRLRLIASAWVTSLVPSMNILDHNQRPAPDPSIVLGEDQVIDAKLTLQRDYVRVISTVHIWKKEPSLEGVKAISGAIRRAVGRVSRLDLIDPQYACREWNIESVRFIRDRDGETSHGVMAIDCLVQQL